MYGLRRKCEELPAWPSGRVRFARAVCLPDSYDRAMTPDGPREIVIDHDDMARAGERVREISTGGRPPAMPPPTAARRGTSA